MKKTNVWERKKSSVELTTFFCTRKYKAFIRKNYLSAAGGTDRPDILTFYPSIAPTFQWGKVPPEADLPFWRALYLKWPIPSPN